MGESFSRLYVCFHHGWNPYEEKYLNMPEEYWLIALSMLRINYRTQWYSLLRPQAELIGQISNPEVFQIYSKHMKKIDEEKKEVTGGEDYYKEDLNGIKGAGVADSHYDPEKGLVDNDGNIIIPKEKYEEMLGLDGVAVSY